MLRGLTRSVHGNTPVPIAAVPYLYVVSAFFSWVQRLVLMPIVLVRRPPLPRPYASLLVLRFLPPFVLARTLLQTLLPLVVVVLSFAAG